MIVVDSISISLPLITLVDDAFSLHLKDEDKAADHMAPPRYPKFFCPQPHNG